MKPEEQRIAIAEACGFTYDSINEAWYKDGYYYFNCGDGLHFKQLPDYLNDLNAMHEAETLVIYANDKLPKKYTQQIKAAICKDAGVKKAQMDFDMCITATAVQRAEAFLKTLNLWKHE
jgi:hypothetical protein